MRSPLSFRSIEWSAAVARLLRQHEAATGDGGPIVTNNINDAAAVSWLRQQTHNYVLPCLPSISNELRHDFVKMIPRSQERMQTIVARQHTAQSLEELLVQQESGARFLVVGGNAYSKSSTTAAATNNSKGSFLTTPQAIQFIVDRDPQCTVWAVVNPNKNRGEQQQQEQEHLSAKLEAGATGIISQPLLSSLAAYHLEQYYRDLVVAQNTDRHGKPTAAVSWVVGLALPRTLKNLLFWLKLVGLEDAVDDDILIKDHVAWFGRNKNKGSLDWIQRQGQIATTLQMEVHGLHWMPMDNTADLMAMLKLMENDNILTMKQDHS